MTAIDELVLLHLTEVLSHAEHEYPSECCGFIRATGVKKCTNILDALHERLPSAYPRTSRTGFVLSAHDMHFFLEAETSADPVRVLYHSHPDREAYFSDEDKAFAIVDGQPTYNVAHLVISVVGGRARHAKLFSIENAEVVETAYFPANDSRISS